MGCADGTTLDDVGSAVYGFMLVVGTPVAVDGGAPLALGAKLGRLLPIPPGRPPPLGTVDGRIDDDGDVSCVRTDGRIEVDGAGTCGRNDGRIEDDRDCTCGNSDGSTDGLIDVFGITSVNGGRLGTIIDGWCSTRTGCR
jgi:hypothetical protein